jgi:hypothetical protein
MGQECNLKNLAANCLAPNLRTAWTKQHEASKHAHKTESSRSDIKELSWQLAGEPDHNGNQGTPREKECSVQPPLRRFGNKPSATTIQSTPLISDPALVPLAPAPAIPPRRPCRSPPRQTAASHHAPPPTPPPTLVNSRAAKPPAPDPRSKRGSLQNQGRVALEVEKMEVLAMLALPHDAPHPQPGPRHPDPATPARRPPAAREHWAAPRTAPTAPTAPTARPARQANSDSPTPTGTARPAWAGVDRLVSAFSRSPPARAGPGLEAGGDSPTPSPDIRRPAGRRPCDSDWPPPPPPPPAAGPSSAAGAAQWTSGRALLC